MHTYMKTNFLVYTFTLLICFNSFFLLNTPAQVETPANTNYTFETIEVPGVEFLAVTASSDFEDYAGYTESADGEKDVAFTLIDGVFTTYEFPGSQNTYFFALGNNGNAAGHYEDTDGLYHGVILEDGELRQYDFPGAVQTQIYGISDATGALTGNFIDAAGVRRGFSGSEIIEYPGASETYADFKTIQDNIVGSYIDADGVAHAYLRTPDGNYISFNPPIPNTAELEYFFVHSIHDVGVAVLRSKAVGDIPRSYVASPDEAEELQAPDSISTEGWNINQDGSIVGHYDTADGRRHGFIARPTQDTEPEAAPDILSYTFEMIDVPGVDFLALTASNDFEDYAGYTQSPDAEKIVGFTLIDGIFTTYSFPGSQNTYFYALGNNGQAAGHYQDSEGLYHGVILENGELHPYDFPGAVETQIHGISDATGALTGSFIDAAGIRRGFSGDIIIEVPGALETYAGFVNAAGVLVGSYVDADGVYQTYVRRSDGTIGTANRENTQNLEYIYYPGISDTGVVVVQSKIVGDVPRTYVSHFDMIQELQVPGSISTEGWNINQDGSIVGHYESTDGRRRGFVARPTQDTEPEATPGDLHYTFETIDVPGVDFLAVTASSDFEDYAGYALSPDSEKEIAWTLIDGVFTTYDFPGSQKTHFYALGNNGQAAGYYEDSNGLYHGVISEDGKLRQYDFPGAVETEIHGISDATGALTGNFIDAAGIRRRFSGDTIIEVPGASETYANFVSATGVLVGSYVDAEGLYQTYSRTPDGTITKVASPDSQNMESLFVHGINDALIVVVRFKIVGDVPRTYVSQLGALQELQVPGSVSTEGWNINQDGSIVGHYDSPDGRRHGFIAKPADAAKSNQFGNFYTVALSKGLNMLSLPLAPPTPMTAKTLLAITGATAIIAFDAPKQRFIAWTPGAPTDGFPIEGGHGYIVNVPDTRNFAFVGAPWTDPTEETDTPAAPAITPLITGNRGVAQETWAFVVSGHLEGTPVFDGYQVSVRNLRTNSAITAPVQGNYFAAATADLTRRSVVQVGDIIELRLIGPNGNAELQPLTYKVTPEHLANAVLPVRLDGIGQPTENLLLQNYPNPFNPETWIPYQLSEDSPVSISIYDTTGKLVRTLSLGFQSAGFYNSQGRAAYWDGRNALGERVASGLYFYQLTTPSFQQTRRLVIVKQAASVFLTDPVGAV